MKNKHKQPLISVIMPVYNAGDFLVDAVDSILNQTFMNFELIIVDDLSTDKSVKIIKKLQKKDKRIRFFRNKKHLGISITLNFAITKAKGKYLARMDADDITKTDRLATQLRYLEENKDVVAVGSQCYIINNKNKITSKKLFPANSENIYRFLFRFNPVQHPTLMINRQLLPKDFVFYDLGFDGAEDLNLLFKLFRYGKITNLNKLLHYYRLHSTNSSLNHIKKIYLTSFLSRLNGVIKYNYKPNFISFLVILVQTVIVLFLPEKIILWLYLKIRRIQPLKLKLVKKLSVTTRFAKLNLQLR